ncbi:hypothetical protein D3C86_2197820 [compost metagenome]
MDREARLKMALELTRLVWDLRTPLPAEQGRADHILDVFASCYQRVEALEHVQQPVVPAD